MTGEFQWEHNERVLARTKARRKKGKKLETWELKLLVNEQKQEDEKRKERAKLLRKLRKPKKRKKR